MDWKSLLQAQQQDFIARLESGELFRCGTSEYSELTIITDERLGELREFCWKMADRYRNGNSSVKDIFINNMKGKLGEEVVKARLGNIVSLVDYQEYTGGDGKVDFTLTADPSIGIQVKARQGDFSQVQWYISREEIQKNGVLVCILIQEEVSEAQNEYHLVLAGFLPTNIMRATGDKVAVKIDELLYGGGLKAYLGGHISERISNLGVAGVNNDVNYVSQSKTNHRELKSFIRPTNKRIKSHYLQRKIAFYRVFAQIAGGATEGLFLSQAFYWSKRTTLDGNWFYKTLEEWQEGTCMTRREIESARKKLVALGILEEKRAGIPCRLYYRLSHEKLAGAISEFANQNITSKERD